MLIHPVAMAAIDGEAPALRAANAGLRPDPERTVALGVLSDPVRRALVERLIAGPCSVSRLAEGFTISRAAISQHLKLMLDAGVVSYRRSGALNVYSINPEPLLRLQGYIADLCEPLRRPNRAREELLATA